MGTRQESERLAARRDTLGGVVRRGVFYEKVLAVARKMRGWKLLIDVRLRWLPFQVSLDLACL